MSSEVNQTEEVMPQDGDNGQEELSVEKLQSQLAQEQKKAADFEERWKRSFADFQNLKRRTDNERSTLSTEAREKLLVKILPIVDDFERALQNLPENLKSEPWISGVNLIEKKLKTLLDQEGVNEVPSKDAEFDPRVHEAVGHDDDSTGEKDYVSEVYQKGYRMGDKVIRPAMVRVARR